MEVEGQTASDIAGSQLWLHHLPGPDPLMSVWNDMEAALLAEKQDWIVWTNWYRDRLNGNEEVGGSIPPGSTNNIKLLIDFPGRLFTPSSAWGAARITETSGCGKLHRNRRF